MKTKDLRRKSDRLLAGLTALLADANRGVFGDDTGNVLLLFYGALALVFYLSWRYRPALLLVSFAMICGFMAWFVYPPNVYGRAFSRWADYSRAEEDYLRSQQAGTTELDTPAQQVGNLAPVDSERRALDLELQAAEIRLRRYQSNPDNFLTIMFATFAGASTVVFAFILLGWNRYLTPNSYYSEVRPEQIPLYQYFFKTALDRIDEVNHTNWSTSGPHDQDRLQSDTYELEKVMNEARGEGLDSDFLSVMVHQFLFADARMRESYNRIWCLRD